MGGSFANNSAFNERCFKRGKMPQFALNGRKLAYQDQTQTENYFHNYSRKQIVVTLIIHGTYRGTS